jgi:hypothetical protein
VARNHQPSTQFGFAAMVGLRFQLFEVRLRFCRRFVWLGRGVGPALLRLSREAEK